MGFHYVIFPAANINRLNEQKYLWFILAAKSTASELTALQLMYKSGVFKSRASSLILIRAISVIFCFTLTLTSCSQNSPDTANSDPAKNKSGHDQQAAQEKLARLLEAKKAKQEADAEKQRLAEEAASKAAQEAAKPRYDPVRLNMAKNWRQWADITIPDLNIKCWLKTNWINGRMHLRLALLGGDKTALRLFSGQWTYLRLVFADQSGVNLHQCMLASKELHWADSLRNSGTPTMEYEADDEISLEVYESIVQWNLQWTNELD